MGGEGKRQVEEWGVRCVCGGRGEEGGGEVGGEESHVCVCVGGWGVEEGIKVKKFSESWSTLLMQSHSHSTPPHPQFNSIPASSFPSRTILYRAD